MGAALFVPVGVLSCFVVLPCLVGFVFYLHDLSGCSCLVLLYCFPPSWFLGLWWVLLWAFTVLPTDAKKGAQVVLPVLRPVLLVWCRALQCQCRPELLLAFLAEYPPRPA